MQVYRVFNKNNVLTNVTEADLDGLVLREGPLSTHHANAAGEARRRDLVPHLRATLATRERQSKLAAAEALLALSDKESLALLERYAKSEEDTVVSNMYVVTALRLRGVRALREAYESPDTSNELKSFIPSLYPGTFDLTTDDGKFLIDALAAHLGHAAPWIASLERPEWQNGVYNFVTTLTQHMPEHLYSSHVDRLREVLERVARSKADADAKREAKGWLKAHEVKE
jgi:hypothetical protein